MQFFISDLHLLPARPNITQAFLRFLTGTAKNAESLYILGDLFDVWVGDDNDIPEYTAITQALADYSSQGHQVFLMHGNRDFLMGDDFAKQAGLTIIQDPQVIELNGVATLLMHGDSLCTSDKEYMAFRQMVRDPQWQQTMLQKPLAERKAIAEHIRSTSDSMNSLKAEDIMDVTPEEVAKIMLETSTVRLIHGHTHRPARHQLEINQQAAERIVLGDWHDKGWYLVADEQGLNLESFDI